MLRGRIRQQRQRLFAGITAALAVGPDTGWVVAFPYRSSLCRHDRSPSI